MRIELAGRGSPIPDLALPDPNLSGDRPTQVLIFADGENFLKAPWIELGYTHYEVWCVGGAGGLGGTTATEVGFPIARVLTHAPDYIWAYRLESDKLWDLELNPPKDFYNDYYSTEYIPGNPNYIVGGVPGVDYGWPMTHYQYVELYNPNHLIYKESTVAPPYLQEKATPMGGGGGGGGVHVVSGELDLLPDSVPVTVGAAGADGGPGQTVVNGLWTPEPGDLNAPWVYPVDMGAPVNITTRDGRWLRQQQLSNLIYAWSRSWPAEHHKSFGPPGAGQDGGASIFGSIGKASGGKGGAPGAIWVGSTLVDIGKGFGGDGGIGGQTTAGGGGKGNSSVIAGPGADGTWDGVIGGGGGGGRGGYYTQTTNIFEGPRINLIAATSGGRGAFSYGDTSVYGQRQYPSNYITKNRTYDFNTGLLIEEKLVATSYMVVPGGGGGVRANHKRLVGSKAQGYSPEGMVLLRLMKLDE